MSEVDRIEWVGKQVVDACIVVHRELGPGLLEYAYQSCLAHELRSRNMIVECEIPVALRYRGLEISVAYRIDMLIDDLVVVENKSIPTTLPVHKSQLVTYMRLSNKRLGFLINWNVTRIKDGIERLVYRL